MRTSSRLSLSMLTCAALLAAGFFLAVSDSAEARSYRSSSFKSSSSSFSSHRSSSSHKAKPSRSTTSARSKSKINLTKSKALPTNQAKAYDKAKSSTMSTAATSSTTSSSKKPSKRYSGTQVAGSTAGGVAAGLIAAEVIDEMGDSMEADTQQVAMQAATQAAARASAQDDAGPVAFSADKQGGVLLCKRIEGSQCIYRESGMFGSTHKVSLIEFVKVRTGHDARIVALQAYPKPDDTDRLSAQVYYEF